MSRTNLELEMIDNLHADFDTAIADTHFRKARVIVDALGEMGFEHEARLLHQAYNRAEQAYLETPEGDLEYEETKRQQIPNE